MVWLGVWYVLRLGLGDAVADCLQTVMVLKYLIKDYPMTTLYFGIANVVANGLVMLRYVCVLGVASLLTNALPSSIVLWVSQNIEDDYTYNLAL